jgi:hypothetical protein
MRWEKIWREAAEAIRARKTLPQRAPLPRPAARRVEKPVEAPAPEPVIAAEPPPFIPDLPPTEPAFAEDEPVPFVEAAPEAIAEPIETVPEPMEAVAEFEAVDAPLPPVVEAEERFDPEAFAPDMDAMAEATFEQEPEEMPAPTPVHLEPEAPHKAAAVTPLPAEQAVTLLARRLPGIDKPIQMQVQNQGSDRFGFLKKLAKRA